MYIIDGDDDSVDFSKMDRGDDFVPEGDAESGDKTGAKTDDKSGAKDAEKGGEKDDDKSGGDQPRGKDGKFVKKEQEDDAGDVDADDDDDDDGDDDDGDDDDDDDALAGKTVPYKRFREVAKARRELKEKADVLAAQVEALKSVAPKTEQQTQQKSQHEALTEELDTLYEAVETKRADGDIKEAAKLQRRIDEINRTLLQIDIPKVSAETVAAATESARYNQMLDYIESNYEQFDPDSPEFDQTVVDTVVELTSSFMTRRDKPLSPSAALRKAATLALGEDPFAAKSKKDADAGDKKPKQDSKPAQKKPDVAKAVDVNKRQAPIADGHGKDTKDNGKIDPRKLSAEDFEKLPESVKARLRGDELE